MNRQRARYIPIRIWVPLIILASVTLLLVAMAWINASANEARHIRETTAWVEQEMAVSQRILQQQVSSENWDSAERTIASLALMSEVRFSALVDADFSIRLASRFSLQGLAAQEHAPQFSQDTALAVQRLNKSRIIHNDSFLQAYYTLIVPGKNGEALRGQQPCLLYLLYDLQPGIQQIRTETIRIFIQLWLISLLFSLLLVWLLNHKISRPLKQLAQAADEIAAGHYGNAMILNSRGEIGVLAAAFNDMNLKVHQSLDALQESETKQGLILSSTAEGIYGIDLDGRCVFANPACLDMLGYSHESEILGKATHSLMHHHHADGRQYPARECRIYRTYVSGDIAHVMDEVFWRKDGSSFPVEYRAHPIRKQGVIVGSVISFVDISERLRLESAEREAFNMMQTILDHAPALISTKDEEGNITFANQRYELVDGPSPSELVGRNIYDLFPEDQADELWRKDLEAQAQEGGVEVEECIQHRDSSWHTYLTRKFALRNKLNELLGTCTISTDITERNQREQQIRLLSQAVEQTPLSVFITDKRGVIQYVNPEFERSSGFEKVEVLGQTPRIMKSGEVPDYLYRNLWNTILCGDIWQGELLNRRKNGELYWENVTVSPLLDEAQDIQSFICIKEDISARKESDAKILRQAQYDALTDLPNRLLAADRLDRAMMQANRNEQKVAVLFIDLDDFKKINDTLGHDIGDALLIEAAGRLQSCVRREDTLSRQGGDEFIVILTDLKESSEAERVASTIIETFSRSFELADMSFMVTASIGIAVYPDDADDRNTLIRHADAAMYQAKDEGRNTFHFFAPDINEKAQRKLSIEQHLQNALVNQELEVYFQPLISTQSQSIVGAEALLRWHNPVLGFVSPAEFIPVAEQTGLILDIGDWVLKTAAAHALQWQSQFNPQFYISVNVSPRQFRGQSIVSSVEAVMGQGLAPTALEIEVTEGLLLRNHPDTQEALQTLSVKGIRIAMDDFGTGYSSLSYVRNFPFTTLKIDQSFVRDLEEDDEDRELVQATIAMALGLGLKVVGEGVETREQYQFLRALSCHVVQGYLFSKPVPADEFSKLLEKQRQTSLQVNGSGLAAWFADQGNT